MDIPFWQQLLITVAGGLAASAIGYYVLHRRLYAVTRYYTRSALSENGKSVAFTILNRGHRSETQVKLELDPARRYALLAASSDDITLDQNILKVERLAPRDDAGAVILVEGGDFNNDHIVKLSSAEAGGKVFKKLEQVPAPPGTWLAFLLIIGLALGIPLYIMLFETKNPFLALNEEQEQKAALIQKIGWTKADDFARSELAAAYSLGEFPVTVSPVFRVEDLVAFDVAIVNKTNEWLTVTVNLNSSEELPVGDCRSKFTKDLLHNLIVPAGSKKVERMIVYVPQELPANERIVRASTSFDTTTASVFGLSRFIDVSKVIDDKKNSEQKACPAPTAATR